MAFTNPILAGEELNSTGIRSANYSPGVSGWRIASDGAAEFDNLGIRGNLWVPSITLNGQDLSTQLNKQPKGIQAWMNGYPVVSTTSGAKLISTEVQVTKGRWYEISLINITPDISNTKQCEFHIKYTTDGSDVTMSSADLAISLRVSQFEMANVRAMWGANLTGKVKLAGTIHSLDGATVRSWAPGNGCVLAVYDMGINPPAFGSIGTSPPVKTLKEFTITAKNSNTYVQSGGNWVRRSDSYQSMLVQGDWTNGKGNQRAWWTFSTSDDATYINDLVGVPQSDIVLAQVKLSFLQWWNDNPPPPRGTVALGFHPQVDNFGGSANEPGGGVPNVHRVDVAGYSTQWININPNDGGGIPTNFMDSLRDGYLASFMVGNTFSGYQYAGIMDGAALAGGAVPPQLHMQYWK